MAFEPTTLGLQLFLIGTVVGAVLLQRFVAPLLPGDEVGDEIDKTPMSCGFWIVSLMMSACINVLLVMECGWYFWR